MNRAYALNRDKLKCRVCGGWLISGTPYAHRVNPNLPLDKVNRVNNLVSLHKKCFNAVNNPKQDISEFDAKAQKKIRRISFVPIIVLSSTPEKDFSSMVRLGADNCISSQLPHVTIAEMAMAQLRRYIAYNHYDEPGHTETVPFQVRVPYKQTMLSLKTQV